MIAGRIAKKYDLGTYFYVDLWPLVSDKDTPPNAEEVLMPTQNDPILYVFDPDIAQQVTVETSLPKYKALKEFLIELVGLGDIVSSDGEYWKKWRQIMVRLVWHELKR